MRAPRPICYRSLIMQHLAERPDEPEMTLAAWADLDEDEPGELVDGRLVEEEEVGALHDAVAAWFVWVLMSWLGPRGGVVLVSDTRFGVAPRRGRKPDTSVYFPGRKPPAQGLVKTPPDIMIEVVSPRPKDARRDRVEKTNEYAAFGVRYYWIVDPALRTFEIFELGADGRYVKAVGAADGTVAKVPGCEGLTIDLDALWARASVLEEGGESGQG
jgi:Uma2 family endonuclease